MILSHGTEEVHEHKEKIIRYRFFTEYATRHGDAVFGLDRPLIQLVTFKSGAKDYSTERRVLLPGPVDFRREIMNYIGALALDGTSASYCPISPSIWSPSRRMAHRRPNGRHCPLAQGRHADAPQPRVQRHAVGCATGWCRLLRYFRIPVGSLILHPAQPNFQDARPGSGP
jgi:hypothetical protein